MFATSVGFLVRLLFALPLFAQADSYVPSPEIFVEASCIAGSVHTARSLLARELMSSEARHYKHSTNFQALPPDVMPALTKAQQELQRWIPNLIELTNVNKTPGHLRPPWHSAMRRSCQEHTSKDSKNRGTFAAVPSQDQLH